MADSPTVAQQLLLEVIGGDPSSLVDGLVWFNGTLRTREGGATRDVDDRKLKVSPNDTTPGFLEDKVESADASVQVSVSGEGADEKINLAVALDETFAAQEIEATALASTSSTTWQNAFLGEPGEYIEAARAGTYFCLFIAGSRMTNSNGVGEVGIGLNSTTPVASSVQQRQSTFKNTIVASKRLALALNDKVYGVFRKESGAGSLELESRSLFIIRIGD